MKENTKNLNTTSEDIRSSTSNNISESEKEKFLKSKWLLLSSIILILIIISAGAAYFFLNSKSQVASCTLEAKICPDGSSVSRTGPKCEFTACPTPTPDITANWKTYTNQKYGFSLKHPSSWDIEEFDKSSAMAPGSILYINTKSKTPSYAIYSTYLSIKSKPENQSLEEFAKPQECIGEGPDGGCRPTTASKQEAIQIGVVQGLWQEAMYGQANYNVKFFIPHGNDVFIFDAPNAASPNSEVKQDLENLNIFKKILSTFKFTDTSPTPTCKPRPACLDATPRCLIPETSDMCPPTTTPSQ